jgi:hypothetical protein
MIKIQVQDVDGWYRAEGNRATFAFCVTHGRVIEAAPYGRKMLVGRSWADAWEYCQSHGFNVSRMKGAP